MPGGRIAAWFRCRAQEPATFSTGVAQLRRAPGRMFIGAQVQTSALFARTALTGGRQSGFGGQHGDGELESSQSRGPPGRTGAVPCGSVCGWGRIAPRRPEMRHRYLPLQRAVPAPFCCRVSDDRQKDKPKIPPRRKDWKMVMRGVKGMKVKMKDDEDDPMDKEAGSLQWPAHPPRSMASCFLSAWFARVGLLAAPSGQPYLPCFGEDGDSWCVLGCL